MAKDKKLTPFNVLFDIPKKKVYSKEEFKKSGANSHLLLNYLKSNNVGVVIAEYLNRNWKIQPYDQYLFAIHILPPQINYIKYSKSDKVIPDDEIDLLRNHYIVSYDVAREYHSLISPEQMERLKKLYKTMGE